MVAFETKLKVYADIVTPRNAALLAFLWAIYFVLRAVYNVSTLHPLHKFPGPKMDSMSYLYGFYFDVTRCGRYSHEIKRMHEVYGKRLGLAIQPRIEINRTKYPRGPIVRINSDELHCNDPQFIDEIYAACGRKRNKVLHYLRHLPNVYDTVTMLNLVNFTYAHL
jgi:hypothetical protein